MMRPAEETIRDAIAWRLRLRDGDAEDWEAFAQWLEGDAARSDAYDIVAIADGGFDPAVLAARPAPVPMAATGLAARRDPSRRRWLAPAAAAAVLLLVSGGWWWSGVGTGHYQVATAAGERKTVSLPGGGFIELNGSSRVLLDRGNPRHAELAAGEAMFNVRHDSSHPFELVAGGHRVQDLGTIFNVVTGERSVRVEVAEGAIVFDPSGPAIRLAAGQTLHIDEDGTTILGHSDPRGVGGWRSGQLSYEGASLTSVVDDLARTMGSRIRLDPRLAASAFTGSIRVDKDQAATLDRLARVLGLNVRRNGGDWVLEPSRRVEN